MSAVASFKVPAEATRHERRLRRKIDEAHTKGDTKQALHHTKKYLASFDARVVATVNACRRLKPHRRPSKKILPEIAHALDPWNGTHEKVVFHFKPKESDEHDFRPIMDFGIKNRSLQHLVLGALWAQADLHPHQYGSRGGTRAALLIARKALMSGLNWVIETDVENCFPSFDGDKVPEFLPIPKEVSRKVIIGRHLNLTPGNITKWVGPAEGSNHVEGAGGLLADAEAEARRGIPQGSSVSSLARISQTP